MTARPAIVEQPSLWGASTIRREGTPSEREKRDQVLDTLTRRRRQLLEETRTAMRELVAGRQRTIEIHGSWIGPDDTLERSAWVSADDARQAFEKLLPPPELNRNCLGAVFRGQPGWTPLYGRRVQSKTKGSHANELKCWTYATPPERSAP